MPIAAEKEPVERVAGLELRGSLLPGARREIGIVHSDGVADAGVSESGGQGEGDEDESEACRGAGGVQDHSPVLCLDQFGDARRK